MREKTFLVEEQHSANQMGSGDLAVLSTPSLIAFMENTAKEESKSALSTQETTVGIEITIQHLKATAIGQTVRVEATRTEQKKTILFYEVKAYEGDTLIGQGSHKRAIVHAERFMEKL